MAKTKDIIIKHRDGLYVMQHTNGQIGFTNKINATHFTSASAAKKQCPILGHLSDLKYIDLNNKRRIKNDK